MELTYRIEDIASVAEQVSEALTGKILLLNGPMGAGKTTFVRALAKVLGSKDEVSSPTFSIVNEHELTDGLLYHFDLYRIKDVEEAMQFGIEEYLDSGHWVVIEWPEKLMDLLPDGADMAHLTVNDDQSRTLKLIKKHNLTENHGKKLQTLNH
ncbi:MAG TPA: tRNA (adenosine(37)-N6)-threonylcarbamoyltransferase complex ATPase subunit type 1 TsaE [Aquaticitalea sp.]|nr:tRNA (adenosine(37)-N6)-threonylcarbamoyltransferase complex ATPase subunit type 1 TsaE [Aquaticitalea sp.]